jgi:hypothetical protein
MVLVLKQQGFFKKHFTLAKSFIILELTKELIMFLRFPQQPQQPQPRKILGE